MAIIIISNKEHTQHNIKRRHTREISGCRVIKTNPQQLQPASIPLASQIPPLTLNLNPKPFI